MYKLDSRSSQIVLSALEELHSDSDHASLAQRAVCSAKRLISADWLTFDFFSKDERYADTAWSSDPVFLDPERMKPFGEFVHQHPVISKALANPNGQALKITDAVSQAEFERTDLYNAFYKQVGVDKQMGVALMSEGDLTMTYAFARKQKDFSESEKAIISLAAPHYVNAIRNGFAFGRMSAALESGGSGVIALDANGNTTFSSSFARRLLETYFGGEPRAQNGLPQTLALWLGNSLTNSRSAAYKVPTRPYKKLCQQGRLTVRLLDNRSSREEVLLLEERRRISPAAFLQFGLTERECDVMFWITEGKTDPDISMLCSISVRTVQKHIENLYRKLGVETRTAALSFALEQIH